MSSKYSHDDCKYFSLSECPHINDDIMKQATQDAPAGGSPTTMSFPTKEEIDNICNNKCEKFTQR